MFFLCSNRSTSGLVFVDSSWLQSPWSMLISCDIVYVLPQSRWASCECSRFLGFALLFLRVTKKNKGKHAIILPGLESRHIRNTEQ